ncbi:hypothetical protein GGF31_001181 [Allomyces arbusculus]|nr:hypothetical protein GGF31_001181 [Allomyces arbusculus]
MDEEAHDIYCKKKMVMALNEFMQVKIHGPLVKKRKMLSTMLGAVAKCKHAAKKRELEGKKQKELKMTNEVIKSHKKVAQWKARLEALIASKAGVEDK